MDSEKSSGEQYFGEGSYETPSPSSPDTYVENALSCAPKSNPSVLKGDFEMDCCQELPQLTLGIIKPDGMKYVNGIENRIINEGFTIVMSRILHLSPEQASNFYYEHYNRAYFPLLVSSLCECPIKVFVLCRHNAVITWKNLVGPTCTNAAKKLWPDCLRAIYGTSEKGFKNVCHASETEDKALEEIKFFFPTLVQDKNFRVDIDVENYMKKWVNPTLLEGLIHLCKNKPLDPVLWLGKWLLQNNPYKPKTEESIAIVPT